jgi:hypothetical protein
MYTLEVFLESFPIQLKSSVIVGCCQNSHQRFALAKGRESLLVCPVLMPN